MIQAIVFLPLLAAIVAGLGNRVIGNLLPSKLITHAAAVSGAPAPLSWPIFLASSAARDVALTGARLDPFGRPGRLVAPRRRSDRGDAGGGDDGLSLVHLYSWGYMAEDPSQPRFFAYLSLFTFAMLMLVTADNLVQMFFGWEGVGSPPIC
jgi:NADH-quinone oxidoreductase subunit L